jgi:hypothetical protein
MAIPSKSCLETYQGRFFSLYDKPFYVIGRQELQSRRRRTPEKAQLVAMPRFPNRLLQ